MNSWDMAARAICTEKFIMFPSSACSSIRNSKVNPYATIFSSGANERKMKRA